MSEESDAIIDYVHEETHRLYHVVEGVRYVSFNRDMQMSALLSLLEYKRYLHTHVTAIMNAALTGTLTPEVLGIKRLLEILRMTPGVQRSFITKEPSIVYGHAKVYPVAVDLASLVFAFILEIPTPMEQDILPLFVVHNVGFHTEGRDALFRVPLPHQFAIRQDSSVVAFDSTECSKKNPVWLYVSPMP